jgi:extracellular factor (EF) 3-hydroxypalmitic acid methyl ester biosynthesis protein
MKNGSAKLLLRDTGKEQGAGPNSTRPGLKENLVTFNNRNGVVVKHPLLRMEGSSLVFEIYQTNFEFKISDQLENFKVFVGENLIYNGRVMVTNILSIGLASGCEVQLDQPGTRFAIKTPDGGKISIKDCHKEFFKQWQQNSKILPEFKLAVLDFQYFLWDLKLLLEQVEISIFAVPCHRQEDVKLEVLQDLASQALPVINCLCEKLLTAARRVESRDRLVHEAFLRRLLHPLVLCAPFAKRTYQKPLGYSGDYEMMNMIHRNSFEGSSLYAKLLHYWFVNQFPAISVRNRVAHMNRIIIQEAARVVRHGRTIRILNVGCGPAQEIQTFLAEQVLADSADFTVLDFDDEALNYVRTQIHEIKNRYNRKTSVHFKNVSIMKLIKQSSQKTHEALGHNYDLIYCGGLFDYFSDQICRQFAELFYDLAAPSGLVVVANMYDRVPFRDLLEFLLGWHLIYRDADCMRSLVPRIDPDAETKLLIEPVAVNLFLEIRKPARK